MKISMWMLFDSLSQEIETYHLGDLSKTRCIQGVLPYEDSNILSESYVYIADASSTPFLLPGENSFFILVGNNVVPDKTGVCQYITLPEVYSPEKAFHIVWHAFEKYKDWYEALQTELNGNADITHICELGHSILHNPVAVYDKEYTLLAYAGQLTQVYLEDKSGPYSMLSSHLLMKLKTEPEYIKTISVVGAGFQKSRHASKAILYVNLNNSNAFDGRLCIPEDIRPVRDGDYQIAEMLAHFIRLAINRQNTFADSRRRLFRRFLSGILDGEAVVDEQLEHSLRQWNWHRHGRYLCLKISLEEHDIYTASAFYTSSKIEHALYDACAFLYKDSLACVVRLTPEEKPEHILPKISDYLEDGLFHLGISDVYDDILKTVLYFQQASFAISMGIQYEPDHWYHFFRDYTFLHLCQNGASALPLSLYCDETVRMLVVYKNTKVDYYTTLKVYLENNMNLLRTAESLFIHRTTLFNRLKHIEEMISVDWNDNEARFRMLLSFKLMETEEKFNNAKMKGAATSAPPQGDWTR